ncbi:MAG TPA: hypothetical protein DCW83_00265 [Saprospirales bacterium]|jgi:hypothetical protein|nr:hypothetical protein [Saprospirales bacterium]|tara:strand:- start:2486 stop:2746 length:261 start_codon:yes stop_codon:yes gene_type:complete
MSDIFDFGFTAVTEEELEAVQDAVQSQASIGENLEVLQEKVDKLYNSMIPLLSNLKKNPQKDYIHWPNRLEKVEQFEDLLTKIYKG